MSDTCECDNCGKRGRRLRGKLAPEDWLFLEHHTADSDEGMTVVWACSKSCALALWKKGPGKLDLMDESSAQRPDPSAQPAFGVDEDVLREVGMTLMLTEFLGVSADAVRATALSRAREYLNT